MQAARRSEIHRHAVGRLASHHAVGRLKPWGANVVVVCYAVEVGRLVAVAEKLAADVVLFRMLCVHRVALGIACSRLVSLLCGNRAARALAKLHGALQRRQPVGLPALPGNHLGRAWL